MSEEEKKRKEREREKSMGIIVIIYLTIKRGYFKMNRQKKENRNSIDTHQKNETGSHS